MLEKILILPHGTQMVVSPIDEPSLRLQIAAKKLVEDIDPSIKHWVLLSPHGISLQSKIALLLNDVMSGYSGVPTGVDFEDEVVHVKVKNWIEFRNKLIEKNNFSKNPILEAITVFANSIDGWLSWGEVIPLHILKQVRAGAKVSVLIMPRDRVYNFENIKNTLKVLGEWLWELLEETKEKTMLIISGDLAHLHSEDGPYGYSDDARKLDEALIKWMKYPTKENLEKSFVYQANGQACGMAGFHVMQEIIDKAKFEPTFYEYQVPTYFGMALASYSRM